MLAKFSANYIKNFDEFLNINSYQFFKRLWNYFNNIFNFLIRTYHKLFLTIFSGFLRKPLRLHLGCGEKSFDNFINIDHRKTIATDYVCDIKSLPFRKNSVETIESYHVIEHLGRHQAKEALINWFKILKNNGKIVIECPDFDEAVKEYIDGNESRIDNIFGYQRFDGDIHCFGYNFERLKNLLELVGFTNIEQKEPTDYHRFEEPCLRVEAIKIERN
tara:strand:+ start:2748 stop:3401 length:654 start_codon:yes stop_codon:yes gene_type:complete